MTADVAKANKGFAGLTANLKKVGIAATAMGAGLVAGLGLSLKSAAAFETGMRSVNSMMGLGQEEFKAFSDEVKTVASDLGVDAVESTKALYQAISAGIPRENILEFMRIATKAAIGGMTDTETAVDGLTTVINAFKMPMSDAQKVADIMFTTVKGGKTTFDELAASLFQVAPLAAASGIRFETVAAALATMTKQGVPTRVATTQLRMAMVALQKPTAEMEEAIEGLGFASGQTMIDQVGFAEALDMLTKTTGGSNEALLKMFGSIEAGQAVMALTGANAAAFRTDLEAMSKATEGAGAATEAYEEVNRGMGRQMAMLKSQFQGIVITIGEVLMPILTDLSAAVRPVLEKIIAWTKENPELTKTITLIVAGVGGLLLVLGPLLIMLPGIIAAVGALGVALTIATGPVGLIVLAIAALVVGGVLLVKNWDFVSERAGIFWERIKDTFKSGVNFLIGLAEGWANAYIKAANMIIGALNSIKVSIPDWVPKIGGKGFAINLPTIPEISIPRLEHGGIVTRPTLALIGEKGPEAVIPLKGGRGLGGITINFNAPVYGIDDFRREVEQTIRDAITGGGFYGTALAG